MTSPNKLNSVIGLHDHSNDLSKLPALEGE